MRLPRVLSHRFRSVFRRAGAEAELQLEMEIHLDQLTKGYVSAGMSEADARLAAGREFGSVESAKEQCRDKRGTQFVDESIRDVRYAWRSLGKSPAFAFVTLLSLALGIGASTAIFNVANAVLLRGLPFRGPDRLVALHEKIPKWVDGDIPFSPPDYRTLAQQKQWFASAGSWTNVDYEVSGTSAPERATGARVTASLFETLGVAAALGRTFTDAEDSEGREVALLSHAYWSRKFGQDPSIAGRTIRLDRRLYTIAGVLPANFVFPPRGLPENGRPADIFVPMSFTPDQKQAYGRQYNHSVVARMQPGITVQQVKAAAPALARRLEDAYPRFFHTLPGFSLSVSVVPLREEIAGKVKTLLLVMLAAVLMVLLVGCANVANLMLARAASRSREMAVRLALGAGRSRLIRQVLAESTVLAVSGGALGVLVAAGFTRTLVAASPIQLPQSEAIGIDRMVLLFAVAISILTAFVFGVAPAVEASRGEAANALREGGCGRTIGLRRRRWLRSFVAIQVASAVVLAVGAGLLVRSFGNLVHADPGFRPEHVLGFSLRLPAKGYVEALQIRGFWERLREGLVSIPGVEAAGFGDLPLAVREGRAIWPEDASAFESNPPSIKQNWTHGEYFRALGMPLLKGRWFTDQDGKDSQRVIILNKTMARIFYPGKDPIGQRLKWGGTPDSTMPWMTVVGVVADIKQGSLQETTMPMTFTPLAQEPDPSIAAPLSPLRTMHVAVRSSGDPAALASIVRQKVAEFDPALPVADLRTMESAIRDAAAAQRFSTSLLAVFAAIALLLASLGVAGIVAYSVAQRRREIGLRVALGASRGTILSMALREALLYTALGIVAGIGAASGLTRLMSSMLYGVPAIDPFTFAGVIGLVGLVAVTASLLPAYRATRLDPMETLRNE